MKKVTVAESTKITCPFIQKHGEAIQCINEKCFAWEVVDERIEREDHSGAREMMYKIRLERKQEITRKGPPGSCGYLILEERGTCVRLFPTSGA